MAEERQANRERLYGEMGLPAQSVSTAVLRKNAEEAYRNYRAELGPSGDPALAEGWRNQALQYDRELRARGESSVGDESAETIEPEQPNSELTLDELTAWGAQHPVHGVDFSKLPIEKQREIVHLYSEAKEISGEAPDETIDELNAAPGGIPPEWIAMQEKMIQEREQQRLLKEQAAAAREAAAEARRAAEKAQDKADREAREQARQEAAEKRAAAAKAEREAREQAKATAAAQKEAAAAQARAAADQQKAEQEAAQKRQLQAQQEAERQARRTRIYADTLGRAATVANNASLEVGNWPRPGGIGLLLVTILFLLFAIVPMNAAGNTRLQLMFLAVVGKVKLPTSGQTSLSTGEGNSAAAGTGSVLSGGGSGSGVPGNGSGSPGGVVPTLPTLPGWWPKITLSASSAAGTAGDLLMPLSALPAASQQY